MENSLNTKTKLVNSLNFKKQGPILFLSSCYISLIIAWSIGFAIWYLVFPRLYQINKILNYTFASGIFLFLFLISSGLILITLTVVTGFDFLYPHKKRSLTVNVLFPIATTLSTFVGISREKLRQSFVFVNNAMTIAQRKRISGDKILILLPHCLQIDKCNRNVTNNINNCQECGMCIVGDLKRTSNFYKINTKVVNGGTLARKWVADFAPSGIVAVACERDLTFGIQDVYPVPVIGVLNDKPNGPCHNTTVDIEKVNEAIAFYKNML